MVTSTTPVETEAELQARLEMRIRAALPLLPAQIKMERYLRLRLGHRVLVIDGLDPGGDAIYGRYDVLVLKDGEPLLIAELKAPDVTLGEDDVRQALSYARLHEPIVPLVLVTNGATTLLRRTYDGAELVASDFASDRLNSVLNAAAALAASASENAVRTLLGVSRDTWAQVFAAWSDEAITAMIGTVRDFKCPIARGLSIPREVVKQLEDGLIGGARVLVLHGPPLSGVTNVLAQLAGNKAVGPILFLDGKTGPDVLQFIANRLSRELSFGISKDDLRSWFNTSSGLLDVTLVIDGLPRNGLDELVESANAGILRLVIGMDSETYRRNSAVSGRPQQSLLGRSAVALELLPLSEEEFNDALRVFDESFGVFFFNGVQHAPELRWPRTLRVLAATLPDREALTVETDYHRETRLMLPPIPGPMTLEACSRAFSSDPMLKFDLQKLAAAFLVEAAKEVEDPNWFWATWGRPSVDPGILEQVLGEQRVERLCEQGFLSWIDTQAYGPRLLVRVEELLSHHVAEEWSSNLAKLSDQDAVIFELERLLRLSIAIPGGEIALAAAISRAAQKVPTVLGVAIPFLIEQEPTTSRLEEGARVELLAKDVRIHMHFGEGMDEEVIGNLRPWIVLSHLASWPMAGEDYQMTVNFAIFIKLGNFRYLLYQPTPSKLIDLPGFHFHDIGGVGSVLCLNTGIVEPLLWAILYHAHSYPDELVSLAKYAMDNKEVHLAWRVLTAALASKTSIDERVQQAAEDVAEVLKEWWGNVLTEAIERHNDGTSR